MVLVVVPTAIVRVFVIKVVVIRGVENAEPSAEPSSWRCEPVKDKE